MPMVKVNVKNGEDRSYDILIGKGVLNRIAADLAKRKLGTSYAIITDSTVARIYGKRLLKKMKAKRLRASMIAFKAGESSKGLRTYGKLIEQVYRARLDRGGCIVALGGGVAGDMAGFVAATYMRGINYVQVPTTLLAMVDSSVGGKVAVNLRQSKNCCGAFYQPRRVYIDTALLRSLPDTQLHNGLAEVVKHAVIKDAKLFRYIERNAERVLRKDPKAMERIVKQCCGIKAGVVGRDERESSAKGERKLLNYGHTVGHAIEQLKNYRIAHGKAVAMGMCAEAMLAQEIGVLSKKAVEGQNALLHTLGLPTKVPRLSTAKMLAAMRRDKKALLGRVEFVLPNAIGRVKLHRGSYTRVVPDKAITKALKSAMG